MADIGLDANVVSDVHRSHKNFILPRNSGVSALPSRYFPEVQHGMGIGVPAHPASGE